ncbi:phosphatase PAP2 family protein [uncultured Phocaeicola sp.]|uniref:phosphatase PAP2 family protein n=1 Tax=uncultured Phocaeicola sp. TaxID=990718 RepID=UPI0025A4DACC|nr:phosphatase PAP2 family protein [uncultured Phocaeicola sp.]
MKRYKLIIWVSFYMIILIIIAAQLWGESGFLHPIIKNINLYVRGLRNMHTPLFYQSYDNYLQLFPGIFLIGLKLGGVKGKFEWKRLLTFIVLSIILTQLVVNSLKLACGVLRPDESNFFSFPSGHTATAFMTATLLYKEYGFKSVWVGIVAYAAAIITGMTRILNNRHWMIDVIVGAALGILLTEMAYRMVKIIFKDRGLINTDYTH